MAESDMAELRTTARGRIRDGAETLGVLRLSTGSGHCSMSAGPANPAKLDASLCFPIQSFFTIWNSIMNRFVDAWDLPEWLGLRLANWHHRLKAPTGLSYRDRSQPTFTPPTSGRSSPYVNDNYASSSSSLPSFNASTSPVSRFQSQRTAEELESQNDERIDSLSAKVKMLKDVGPN